MDILEEIKLLFASLPSGAARLKTIEDYYPTFVIRNTEGVGVAIEWDKEEAISEHFANAHFFSAKMNLSGEEKNVLVFQSFREDLRNEFACVCAQFVEPGEDGKNRFQLINDPLSWWKRWRNLLGNTILDKAPYSVLSEMMTLYRIYENDKTAVWTGAKSGTHDIETSTNSYEVKSTIRRYGASITVSGQFQFHNPKPLSLFFYRMEESPYGLCINDMINNLTTIGYDEALLEHQLYTMGYEKGASARDKKYTVLEKRLYDVNDDFPKITEESFAGNAIPNGVIQIVYTVDLDGVAFSVIKD